MCVCVCVCIHPNTFHFSFRICFYEIRYLNIFFWRIHLTNSF